MDQKKGLLVVLLVLWGGLVFYRVFLDEGLKRAPLKYVKGATVQAAKKEEDDSPMKIKTELFNSTPPASPDEVKNIFAPLAEPKPPAPPDLRSVAPRPPPSLPPPLPAPPPPVAAPTPEELALAQAKGELAEIRYLGFLDRGNGKPEGFFSRRQETVIGEKGGLLFGRFTIRELSSSLAIIADKNTKAEVTLQLSEGKNEK